jgi:hypothetical protein
VANFADYELLSLHELLMDCTLHAKELGAHRQSIQDPELQRLADKSLQAKQRFVNQVRQILT